MLFIVGDLIGAHGQEIISNKNLPANVAALRVLATHEGDGDLEWHALVRGNLKDIRSSANVLPGLGHRFFIW